VTRRRKPHVREIVGTFPRLARVTRYDGHAAHTLPGLTFESVRDKPLAAIWRDAPGLARFRGDAWLPEPCGSCPRKAIDHGGCRCQAHHLTGDAAATDPACSLSPAHGLVEEARLAASVARAAAPRYLYRTAPRTPSPRTS